MADQAVTLNPNAFLAWLARGHVYRFCGATGGSPAALRTGWFQTTRQNYPLFRAM